MKTKFNTIKEAKAYNEKYNNNGSTVIKLTSNTDTLKKGTVLLAEYDAVCKCYTAYIETIYSAYRVYVNEDKVKVCK